MNKYLLITAVLITTASLAFFNMPQQMMGIGSQMMQMSPLQQNRVQSNQPCECTCKNN